jgi:multiple sugar transport system permease protein
LVKKKSLWVKIKENRVSYLFILPSVVMFFALVALPIFLTILYSFQKRNLVQAEWVGFAQYVDIFTDPVFLTALKNTFLFVVVLVPVIVMAAFYVSLQVTPLNHKARIFFRAVFYLPVVVSGVIISLIWLWIFNVNYGLLNYLIGLFGAEPIEWLAHKNTIFYLMFVVFTFNLGVPFIIYVAAMGNIPTQLLEVARIDGAKKRTITWKIIFPLLKPVTFFLVVTQTIFVFMVFVVIQLLTRGGPAHSTETIIFQLYRTAFQFLQFGRAAAMGVSLLIFVLIISILQKLVAGRDIDY